MGKPTTAEGYDLQTTRHAIATCLYVATRLGDLMDDMVVVGGLAPSLLISQDEVPPLREPHIGTMDLDLGLNVELLTTGLYQTLTDRLRSGGFTLDTNERGNPTRQRWRPNPDYLGVGVDFLIQPSSSDDLGGRLRNIQPDLVLFDAEQDRGSTLATASHASAVDRRRGLDARCPSVGATERRQCRS